MEKILKKDWGKFFGPVNFGPKIRSKILWVQKKIVCQDFWSNKFLVKKKICQQIWGPEKFKVKNDLSPKK